MLIDECPETKGDTYGRNRIYMASLYLMSFPISVLDANRWQQCNLCLGRRRSASGILMGLSDCTLFFLNTPDE